MDFNALTDAIVLLVCGALVGLYGAGILFPKAAEQDSISKGNKKVVTVIGGIIFLAGVVQLIRYLLG